jgi:hypothetical protein
MEIWGWAFCYTASEWSQMSSDQDGFAVRICSIDNFYALFGVGAQFWLLHKLEVETRNESNRSDPLISPAAPNATNRQSQLCNGALQL